MKALIVDDSISVRKALERILSTRDVATATAGSAEEALALLPHAEADIIITDVVMPGMSGFELCEHIKTETDFNHLPVVLISGVVDEEVNAAAARVGAASIVTKPFTPDELFPKLDAAMNGESLADTVLPAPSQEALLQEAVQQESSHEDDALLVLEDDLVPEALDESEDLSEPAYAAADIEFDDARASSEPDISELISTEPDEAGGASDLSFGLNGEDSQAAEPALDFSAPLAFGTAAENAAGEPSDPESSQAEFNQAESSQAEPFSDSETVLQGSPSSDVLPPVAEPLSEEPAFAGPAADLAADLAADPAEPHDYVNEADASADDALFDAPRDEPARSEELLEQEISTSVSAEADVPASTSASDLDASSLQDDELLLFVDEDFEDIEEATVSLPPAYVNTSAPQFEGPLSSEALSDLSAFLRHPSVRAALVVDATGNCTAFEGQTQEVADSLASYVSTLMSIAGVLGGKLGAQALSHFHLEYEGASLVLFKLNQEHKLLLSLDDSQALGVLHYLVRRYVENAGDAVAG